MRKPLRLARDLLQAHEALRFVIVGVGAAVLFYAATVVLLEAGMAAFPATLSAYVMAFAIAYTAQHAWTFRGRRDHRAAFPRYLATQALAAITAATVARAVGTCGAPPVITAAASTLSGSALSFVLSRIWVFGKPVGRLGT